MRQNNLGYSKVFAAVFVIVTIIALILYFIPEKQPLNWLSLDEAKKEAMKSHKPILVNFYSRWSAECKTANKTIFSDDNLKTMMKAKYILAKVSLDNKNNKELAKNLYEIKGLPTFVILSQNAREISRISGINFYSLNYWLQETPYKIIDSWMNFDEGKAYAEKNNKILLVYLITQLNRPPGILSTVMRDDKLQLLIAQDYVPVYLIASDDNDRKIIKNLFGSLDSAPYGEVMLLYYKGKELESVFLNPELLSKPELLYNKLSEVIKKKSDM